ncbi:MAG: sugar ABC transporter permease [Caldilineaceae bacterium]|nr:sugar ABC transporter permease [Caldilineaceae bacterium]MBP8106950.1 sugar ABC transporter permease [Caldilineaceae bacterium]MBP8121764.1 sugar ABC transporter permease [Caldilineaceae bacterium]MBP9072384.1 sugar ABC transporter permease [Caldilineaceae bacterium]
MTQSTKQSEDALTASRDSQPLGEYMKNYMRRVRSGDLGSLPIILGVIVIAIIFQTQNQNFLTARNFVNLILQMAAITSIAYGVVYVLLLGEIDLSVAYVSAVAGVGMTLLMRPPSPWPWWAAVAVALLVAGGIGLIHGLIITTFQVPSFVVTLAGLLAWNGVVLIIIGGSGTVIIQDKVIIGVANYFLPDLWGWIVAGGALLLYAGLELSQHAMRRKQGLATRPMTIVVAQMIFLAVITFAAVYVANQDRGVPFVGVLLLVLLAGLSFLANRTKFGRYVYAVGGNKEAARRAGINVERIRVTVFVMSSMLAGVGGIILASRLRSVATDAGGGNLLLNSIAAAVIGGTSLFGGSGKVSSALLGALVIASVENGMGLLGLSSGVKFVVTGLVLLLAVLVDSVSRRSRAQSGLG